ncbi:FabD/lysophospholipase-like protein [Atractiella rhizophila]|nr:FabD/lysophospholipase-like protein [Atractiella rhizophila]KAH8924136.1 FabD/lysophospholipase-like protein [Atractiella rhizophila]
MADKVYVPPCSTKVPNPHALRVLCLDGGGIRGLSELVILIRIMETLQNMLDHHLNWGIKSCVPSCSFGSDEKCRACGYCRVGTCRPCDFFDLICGSSAGGLIALLLGRLGLTAQEAYRIFEHHAKDIFPIRALL